MKNTLLMILMILGIACSDSGITQTENTDVGVAAEAVASMIPSAVQKNVRDSYTSSCTWDTMGSVGQMWAACGSTWYRADYSGVASNGNWKFRVYRRVYPGEFYYVYQTLVCSTVAKGTGCTRTAASSTTESSFGAAGSAAP